VWNQTFDIPIYSEEHILKVSCLDKDLLMNDLIGETLVRMRALTGGVGKRSWLSLYYKREFSGEILIEVV